MCCLFFCGGREGGGEEVIIVISDNFILPFFDELIDVAVELDAMIHVIQVFH